MAGRDVDEIAPQAVAWSLRRAFARLLVLTAFLPALVFGLVTVGNQHLVDRTQVAERLGTSATLTAASITDYLQSHMAAVALLADARQGGSPDWEADLRRLQARYPDFVTVLATDASGQVLAAQPLSRLPEGPLPSVADRDYFSKPRERGMPHISDAFRGRGMGNDALIAVSAPWNVAGRFGGVVEGSIPIDTFARQRGDAFQARGYEFLLLDATQHVVYATKGLGLHFLQQLDDPRLLDGASDGKPAHFEEKILTDGGNGFVASADLRNGWRLVLVAREAPLLEALAGRGLLLLGLMLLLTLGVVASTWRQMRQLNDSTRGLLQSLRGFALGTRLSDDGMARMPVELQPVASAIDDLAGRLNAAYDGLNESLDRQRELAASLRTVVATREREVEARTEELREAVAELDRISRTDALTGCLNYRGLLETMQVLWDASADGETGLAVLALDVDHFKAYNDHYGHQKGDNALRRFAGAVRSALYEPGDIFARSGGEEFIVLLPDTSLEQALSVAERICEQVRLAGISHEAAERGVLTVSIGGARREPQDGDDPEALLRRADLALYRAKDAGRNQVSS